MPSSEKPDLQEEPTDMGTPQELPPHTIFSLRNDRNILNELVAYESIPFSCAAIICVFTFFVLCVIIVGSFGMILSVNYEKSFEDGKSNFSETCASHESWIDVYSSLKDGQECDLVEKRSPYIECFNMSRILNTSWSNWSKCEDGFKYQVRLIDKHFSVLKVLPSQVGELYNRNECYTTDLPTSAAPSP